MGTRTGSVTAQGVIDVAFILLALQCGIGFLSALGELLLAAFSGALLLLLWSLLFGFGVPAALAVCAFGLESGRRRAWQLVLACETLLASATALRWLFGMLPVSSPLALATGALLPLLIGGLLLTPAVRLRFRRPARQSAAAPTGATFLPLATGHR